MTVIKTVDALLRDNDANLRAEDVGRAARSRTNAELARAHEAATARGGGDDGGAFEAGEKRLLLMKFATEDAAAGPWGACCGAVEDAVAGLGDDEEGGGS